MKNGTYDCVICFLCEALVSELQFVVQHSEAGVKTQSGIAILTFKSYRGQHNYTLHFGLLNLP